MGTAIKAATLAVLLAETCFLPSAAAEPEPVDRGLTYTSLAEAVDSVASKKMRRLRIPGAVVIVVKDGEVILARGYGVANSQSDEPVGVDSTLFRMASLSKLFTTVAVLQLHEHGLIDVGEPIDPYLGDVRLPLQFPEPVTFHHLLTHTAGFDMTDIGDAAKRPEEIVPLEQMVRRGLPPQIFHPGEFFNYSNHGFLLAGYLVGRLSGESFEDYIRVHVFDPLGMTHSTFQQPIPKTIDATPAVGFTWGNVPSDYSNIVPADGLISSGGDMSLFMIALLNGGSLNGQEILMEKTVDLMFRQQFTRASSKEGMAYGFHEEIHKGWRVLEHSGAQLGFLSLLQLVPEKKIGVLIVHNSRGISRAFRQHVSRVALDALLESKNQDTADLIAAHDDNDDVSEFAGIYRTVNYPRSTFEKVMTLFGRFSSEIEVATTQDGGLSIGGDRYFRLEGNLFGYRDGAGMRRFEFLKDNQGHATHLVRGREGYERIPWYEAGRIKLPVFFGCLFLLATRSLYVSVHVLWRKFKTGKTGREGVNATEHIVDLLQYWAGTSLVLAFAGIVVHFRVYGDQLSDYGVPASFKLVLLVASCGGVLSAILPVTTIAMWRSKSKQTGGRLLQTVLNCAAVVVAVYLFGSNVIGINFL